MSNPVSTPAQVIDGTRMAQAIRGRMAKAVAEMKDKHNVVPGLAVILVGEDPGSATYVRNKGLACQEVGIYSETFQLPRETTQDELLDLVGRLNADQRFHGILVQLPLPPQIQERPILWAIDPAKDVEGLHPINMGRLVIGEPRFVPCAPAGIQQMLLRSGHDPEGKHVVICGNSTIMGKPLAILLMQSREGAHATVTVCHIRTRNLSDFTRQADILISAMGKPQAITADMVKEGSAVIDVGIIRVKDPSRKRGYRLVGDVDFEGVRHKVAAITPVPGGVGPMTVAMLLVNTLKAAHLTIHPRHN
ncbi:MAG: bifunctional methylenetetrahydrofolate dehydrogenase/methenyltetrahydrofolate cyclohydrolase FolD [Dehalococcoidia bacterium]